MKTFSKFAAKILLLSLFGLAVLPVLAPVADAYATTNTGGTTTTGANNGVATDDNVQGQWIDPDSNNNSLSKVMCNALKIVTGSAGKAFAAFAIISVGIGFFTGKVSWGLMIGVAAGIAAMFGAPTIVAAITGEQAFDCTN